MHDAFFSGPLVAARLTSIRRDEERSFRAAPHARAYYLCAALTADLLAPARGLLAVSTWNLDRRVIGPLSPRVDYLTAAVHVAESVQRLPDAGAEALRLLRNLAVNIPGAHAGDQPVSPDQVVQAARAELAVHQDEDTARRTEAAARARSQLSDTDQLFGTRLRTVSRCQAGAWPAGCRSAEGTVVNQIEEQLRVIRGAVPARAHNPRTMAGSIAAARPA